MLNHLRSAGEIMSRSVTQWLPAVGILGVALLCPGTGVGAEPQLAPATAPTNGADARDTEGGKHAVERARKALQDRKRWVDGLTVESVTAQQWSDSSLACGRPGTKYLQVITSGYSVIFTGKDTHREVHVAGEKAVLCDDTIAMRPRVPRVQVPLQNLDPMITAARADLASRIGAKPEAITLINWAPLRLPARVLRCEVAEDRSSPAVPGYKIVLGYQGRAFPYQSDLGTVVACPPIERE
jgi:hypothetical protein